jgi:Fur family transcriptional regulator, ferric uptake regulator
MKILSIVHPCFIPFFLIPMLIYDADTLKATLHQRGFRLTNQRQVILKIFQDLPSGQHLDAHALHLMLLRRGERMSISTVYRNLHWMSVMGFLRELELCRSHKSYEINTFSSHHHLVCAQCGHTLEFSNKEVIRHGEQQAKAKGYEVLDYQLVLRVLCPEAMKKEEQGLLSQGWKCARDQSQSII